MKKHRTARLLSVILAVVMIFGSISVGVTAAYAPYLDDALTDNYNTIDQVTLTEAQQASLLLDKVDRALADANIVIDVSVVGTLNLTSIDNALSSIYSVTGNILFSSATVGDLAVLKTHRADIASVRRSTAGATDVDVLNSIVTYLGHCAGTLSKLVDGSFNWAIVKSYLPSDIRIIIDDIPNFIKETLWNLVHPTTSDPMPAGETLDQIVQYILDNQVGGKNAAAVGFDGILPGFDLDLATANGYRAIEEVAFRALNQFLVPLMNSGLKGVIQNAITTNSQKGGNLAALVNPDYIVTAYPDKSAENPGGFDTAKGFTEQLNAILGHYVNEMLQPGQTLFTWRMTANAGETQAQLVEDNISSLIKVIIPLGGDTIDTSGMDTMALATYIARSAVQEFVKHVTIPADASLREIAVIGMKEFIATIVPEKYDSIVVADTNEAILDCAKVIGTYYFNNLFDFDYHPTAANDTFDNFLAALLSWGMQYADGILAISKDGITAANVWEKIDTAVFAIADRRWFNYEEMFRDADGAGSETDLTAKTLVNYVMDTLLNVNFDKLFAFFDHSANSSLNSTTAKSVIIGLVTRIVNGLAPGTIPSTISSFEDALNTATLKAAFQNLLEQLSSKKETLMPTVLNLLISITGFGNEQSLGKAGLSLASRVYCDGGNVPSGQTMRISNLSNGLNRGWRDAAGVLHQDAMYKLKLVSLTNTAGLTTGAVADTVIDANDSIDVAISGSVANNTEVRFDLAYHILDETGAVLTDTPQVVSTYSYFYKTAGNYEATNTAGEQDANHANCVLIEGYPTYLYTTDVNQVGMFNVMARHYYHLTQGQNGSQRILNAVVNGTLPAGVSANAPEAGSAYDYILLLDGVGMGQSSYGRVSPYAVSRDVNDPQPYGIYDVTFQFDIRNEGGSVKRTGAIDHKIVIYNDFGLPGLLSTVMGASRQRADYQANADAEWNAYLAALEAGYALTQGNPDHSKMFADPANPDGSDNAYKAAVDAINAAVTALDAKVKPTNAAAVADLKATLQAQEGTEYFDFVNYELFTFRRWQSWFNSAWSIVNSQNVAEGETAPAVRDLDIKYAKHMVELLYPRMITKAADKTALNAALTTYGNETQAGKAPDTWADYAAAKAFALEVQADSAAIQAKVNTARVELMKAYRNLKTEWIIPEEGSGLVVDSRQMFIYGLFEGLTDLVGDGMATTLVGAALDYDIQGDALATGSYIKVMVLKDTDLEQVALYTAVLFGDLNGDGAIDAADQTILNGLVDGTGDRTGFFSGGPFFTAADLNSDGQIDATDKAIMDAHMAGTYVIDQTGNNALPTA